MGANLLIFDSILDNKFKKLIYIGASHFEIGEHKQGVLVISIKSENELLPIYFTIE